MNHADIKIPRDTNVTLIVAADKGGGIGYKNQMPWHIPEDLQFFKTMTTSFPIIMGRHTYESIGKPLPHRTNIVVSRSHVDFPDDVHVATSIQDAFDIVTTQYAYDKVFVIGGADIFRQTIPYADNLLLTQLHEYFPADTYLPPINWEDWIVVRRDYYSAYTRILFERHLKAAYE